MACIFLNMVTMCMDYYDQEPEMENILSYLNYLFIAIFSSESVIKLIAMNWRYFTIPWNVFDFVIVILSIAGLAFESVIKKYLSISPTVLRVVRVARVGRVLRLVKGARGIRTLLFALAVSLPALVNIGLLLFLIIFIYSIFGMNFFMHVGYSDYLTPEFNFETIYQSMITLFPLCTSAGWSTLLEGLSNDSPPKCNPNAPTGSQMTQGDCGSRTIAVPFLITFLILTFLIVINMYIAVILENFSQAREEVQQGLTDDDYDMYYEIWQRYDPKCTEFLPYDRLFDFVDSLDAPLKVAKPNRIRLISMNLTICEGDKIHCTDILDALTKNFLGADEELDENIANQVGKKERPRNYQPITTTMQRQRQEMCARIIVRTMRRYIAEKKQKQSVVGRRPSSIALLEDFSTDTCVESNSDILSNNQEKALNV
jgi:voltage-gated sodium channel type II alpha